MSSKKGSKKPHSTSPSREGSKADGLHENHHHSTPPSTPSNKENKSSSPPSRGGGSSFTDSESGSAAKKGKGSDKKGISTPPTAKKPLWDSVARIDASKLSSFLLTLDKQNSPGSAIKDVADQLELLIGSVSDVATLSPFARDDCAPLSWEGPLPHTSKQVQTLLFAWINNQSDPALSDGIVILSKHIIDSQKRGVVPTLGYQVVYCCIVTVRPDLLAKPSISGTSSGAASKSSSTTSCPTVRLLTAYSSQFVSQPVVCRTLLWLMSRACNPHVLNPFLSIVMPSLVSATVTSPSTVLSLTFLESVLQKLQTSPSALTSGQSKKATASLALPVCISVNSYLLCLHRSKRAESSSKLAVEMDKLYQQCKSLLLIGRLNFASSPVDVFYALLNQINESNEFASKEISSILIQLLSSDASSAICRRFSAEFKANIKTFDTLFEALTVERKKRLSFGRSSPVWQKLSSCLPLQLALKELLPLVSTKSSRKRVLDSLIAAMSVSDAKSGPSAKRSWLWFIIKHIVLVFVLYSVFFVICGKESSRVCPIRPHINQAEAAWNSFTAQRLVPAWEQGWQEYVQPTIQLASAKAATLVGFGKQQLDQLLIEWAKKPEWKDHVDFYLAEGSRLSSLMAHECTLLARQSLTILLPYIVMAGQAWHDAAVHFVDVGMPWVIKHVRFGLKWCVTEGLPLARRTLQRGVDTASEWKAKAIPILEQYYVQVVVVLTAWKETLLAWFHTSPTVQAVRGKMYRAWQWIQSHPQVQAVSKSEAYLVTRSTLALVWEHVSVWCVQAYAEIVRMAYSLRQDAGVMWEEKVMGQVLPACREWAGSVSMQVQEVWSHVMELMMAAGGVKKDANMKSE